MIDVHSHILPDVDDGAIDWDDTLAMLALAARTGTGLIVATPHSHQNWRPDSPCSTMIPRLVAQANERAARAGLSIEVVSGQECMIDADLLEEIGAGRWLTLGGSRTVLLELSFSLWPPYTDQIIQELQGGGYRVLLAHPERYRAVQEDPNLILPLVRQGVLTQVTSGSITGHFGKRARESARLLLEHGLAHVVASDAHNTRSRPPELAGAREIVEEWLGEEDARRLFVDTPRALLQDEPVSLPDPQEIVERKGTFRLF